MLKISSIGFVDAVLRHGKPSFVLCGPLCSIALDLPKCAEIPSVRRGGVNERRHV